MKAICINCKWHRLEKSFEGTSHRCYHPTSASEHMDLVTGKVTVNTRSCGTMRNPTAAAHGLCGEKGTSFESKESN